jgi:hypothetical protein
MGGISRFFGKRRGLGVGDPEKRAYGPFKRFFWPALKKPTQNIFLIS